MTSRLVVYGSEHGTARGYAEQFAKRLSLPVCSYEEMQTAQEVQTIIHFGALYAGGVKGLKDVVKHLPSEAKLVLCTVGLADVTDPKNTNDIVNSIKRQVPQDILNRTKIFHFRGGIDYAELSFKHKTMMALLYRKAKSLPDEKKTAEVRAMIETYNTHVDFSDYSTLAPLEEYIRNS